MRFSSPKMYQIRWGSLQRSSRPPSWRGGACCPLPRTHPPLSALRVSHSAYTHFILWRRLLVICCRLGDFESNYTKGIFAHRTESHHRCSSPRGTSPKSSVLVQNQKAVRIISSFPWFFCHTHFKWDYYFLILEDGRISWLTVKFHGVFLFTWNNWLC